MSNKKNQIREEASKVRTEITKSLPKNIDFKGYHPELVDKLAACRVYRFRENELNELLTEIVKQLHRR